MKSKTILIHTCLISLFFFGILMSYGYAPIKDNYESNMLGALKKLDVAKTEADFNVASALFYDIGKAAKSNWLPYYYAGLSKTLIILELGPKQIDQICDEAFIFISKSDSLNPNNSEILVLKSMNYSARLVLNSVHRATKYNKLIYKTSEQALQLDKANPRAYLQKAQYIYHTPSNFGGGASKALPVYQEALKKFSGFKPKTNISPNWGKDLTEKMIEVCKADVKKGSKK